MSVKIDMEMPENCAWCRLFKVYDFGERATCVLNYRINISKETWLTKRHKDCPLKECE